MGGFLSKFWHFPEFIAYNTYDRLIYLFYGKYKLVNEWGIHLFCGDFGQGKTSTAVIRAYRLCCKYPQLTVYTNINLTNFPKHTKIIKCNKPTDLLTAPDNSLFLFDEIGTLFNSRDFASSKESVPKPVQQQICQNRKRKIILYGTLPYFPNLDKQLRDVTTTITDCEAFPKYPFSRFVTATRYPLKEYDAFIKNCTYVPKPDFVEVMLQTDKHRQLYNTNELVKDLIEKEYISDAEILANQGTIENNFTGTKEAMKAYKKANRRRR